MMIFRAITPTLDWQFGQGQNSYLTGSAAIAANVKTRLLFWLNDFFAAMDSGIDWRNLLGSKNPAAQVNILLQTRATIIQSEGVVSINSVMASTNPTTRRLSITYSYTDIYGQTLTNFIQQS